MQLRGALLGAGIGAIAGDAGIPKEVFKRVPDGYAGENHCRKSYAIRDPLSACDADAQKDFNARIDALTKSCAEMSDL